MRQHKKKTDGPKMQCMFTVYKPKNCSMVNCFDIVVVASMYLMIIIVIKLKAVVIITALYLTVLICHMV